MILPAVWDFVNRGGTIAWILVGFYIIVCTITLEKVIFFIKTYFPQNMIMDLILQKKDNTFILEKYNKSQVWSIFELYNNYFKKVSGPVLNEKIEREVFCLIEKMQQYLWILLQISHVAPLLGLLGTILGLISSFKIMASLGPEADVTTFAGGIWEAMITTALGLIVAIPAILLYKTFEKIIEHRSSQISQLISLLNEHHGDFYENL